MAEHQGKVSKDTDIPTTPPQWPSVVFAILLGTLGAILNTQSVPFLPEVQLIFGNAFFIFAAMRLKPSNTLLCALITVFPLYFYWGHPFGFITFGLEAFFIAKMREKGWFILFADIFYWLFIGMPLTSLIIWANGEQVNNYWMFISLKQTFNATLYTSLACLVAFFLDRKLRFPWLNQKKIVRTLRQQLVYSIVLIALFSLITATLFISRNLITSTQELVHTTLQDSAKRFANVAQIYLDNQKNVIRLASTWLGNSTKDEFQNVLTNVHRSSSGFLTMLVTDEVGDIINASPTRLLKEMGENSRSVADRDYFQKAMFYEDLYVSPVFKGRGFGNDTIIAISSPIIKREEAKSEPIGIVEGSIDLSLISKLTVATFGKKNIEFVLVDHHNNVVFASQGVPIEPLLMFDYIDNSNHTTAHRMVLDSVPDTEFAYASARFANNWQVYTLLDYEFITDEIERQYIIIFITLFVCLTMAGIVANQFGKRLTNPLNFIIDQLNKKEDKNLSALSDNYRDVSIEINHLYSELQSNKAQVLEYQEQLEEKVNERTAELNKVNEKLQDMALIDGLTKVKNRRYLDDNFEIVQKSAQRNDALMALVMVDLDHFKKLNDKFGHLAGDEVLVRIAQIIKHAFNRDTDIVVRFGGEEFLILAPYITLNALNEKLEQLRKKIANELFVDHLHNKYSTSASFGAYISDASYSDELLRWIKIADKNLYLAKDTGRNKVIIEERISRAKSQD